jgi:hypothetical protein
MRALGIFVLIAIGVTLAAFAWWPAARPQPTSSTNDVRTGSQPELSERVMASKGFLPPGAPVAPPARPTPRPGAQAADFADLAAFEFEMESAAIPDAIEALRGKTVEVIGVMYFSVEDPDHVAEFYLMPDHMICCFGTPRINQIVDVRLADRQATRYTLDYYLIRGVLEIGPFFDEDGLALCLYRIAEADVELLQ